MFEVKGKLFTGSSDEKDVIAKVTMDSGYIAIVVNDIELNLQRNQFFNSLNAIGLKEAVERLPSKP